MNKESTKIPSLLLERAALGELSPAQLEDLRARFGADVDEQIEALRAANQEWSESTASEVAFAQLQDRLRRAPKTRPRPHRFRSPTISSLFAVAACIALLIGFRSLDRELLVDSPSETAKPPIPEFGLSGAENRLKGLKPHLTLHRKRGSGQEELSPSAQAKAGDIIQVSYIAAQAKHGVIFSIDGRGQVTLHFPASAQHSSKLLSSGAVPLDHAYELDAAPEFERFFLVTIPHAKAPAHFVQNILQRAEKFAKRSPAKVRVEKPRFAADYQLSTFLLQKI